MLIAARFKVESCRTVANDSQARIGRYLRDTSFRVIWCEAGLLAEEEDVQDGHDAEEEADGAVEGEEGQVDA